MAKRDKPNRKRAERYAKGQAPLSKSEFDALLDIQPKTGSYPNYLKTGIKPAGLEAFGLTRASGDHLHDAARWWIFEERCRKLFALLDYFEVSRASELRWFQLAFHLAKRDVPAMKVARRRGPKTQPKSPESTRLYLDLLVIMHERKKGLLDAIRILQKRKPKEWKRYSPRTLQRRFYETDMQLKKIKRENVVESLRALLSGSAD